MAKYTEELETKVLKRYDEDPSYARVARYFKPRFKIGAKGVKAIVERRRKRQSEKQAGAAARPVIKIIKNVSSEKPSTAVASLEKGTLVAGDDDLDKNIYRLRRLGYDFPRIVEELGNPDRVEKEMSRANREMERDMTHAILEYTGAKKNPRLSSVCQAAKERGYLKTDEVFDILTYHDEQVSEEGYQSGKEQVFSGLDDLPEGWYRVTCPGCNKLHTLTQIPSVATENEGRAHFNCIQRALAERKGQS